MNTKSTELNHIFESKDDEDFTRYFWKNLGIAIGIGFIVTIGLIFAVLNADRIDAFFAEIIKAIFI